MTPLTSPIHKQYWIMSYRANIPLSFEFCKFIIVHMTQLFQVSFKCCFVLSFKSTQNTVHVISFSITFVPPLLSSTIHFSTNLKIQLFGNNVFLYCTFNYTCYNPKIIIHFSPHIIMIACLGKLLKFTNTQ
jgi:hypothetical protein